MLGVSNISFGLPARGLINQNFLTMAMAAGLDLPIINPNVEAMMAAVRCYHLLTTVDENAADFIAAYGNATVSTSITSTVPSPQVAQSSGVRTLAEAVQAGLKAEAAAATQTLLEQRQPMDIVNEMLIPALDRVGAEFEQNKVFLPQLIQSAGAAQAAFDVIRQHMATGGQEQVNRGTIAGATAKGDIHDIGKHIVKLLLATYGDTAEALGRVVDPSRVVEAVRQHKAPLVGLSALMTTTVKSMEETITQLRQAELPCQVMVGGAVLTPEYARQIGADFYAKDAKDSADIAKQVFSQLQPSV